MLGAVLLPSIAEGDAGDATTAPVQHDAASDTLTESRSAESILDDLTLTDVVETLADDHFSFDGRNILVEDPAPLGPFLETPADAAGGAETEATASGDRSEGPLAAVEFNEAFSRHSRPDATHTIFLDFDGHTVTGTAWNSTVETIEAGRYRRESAANPDTGFTQGELDGIAEIWERVSEDFAAWDVDVTTEDPGVAALTKSSSEDDEYGIRTIITTDYEWYDTRRFGGVAYLRSFSRNDDLPAWVFSSNLAMGKPKSVAEAVSHEVGHTLGLRHDGIDDGTTSSTYYAGHGSWAPIMGVGYYRTVTQWSTGDYAGATNTEDDLAIIDGFIDRRSNGSVLGGSTLPSSGTSTTQHVLDESGETNIHSLEVSEGPVTVTVDKLDADGNVLAGLTIRDPLNQVVASASPLHPATWSLSASLPVGVTPGEYTVEVQGVGWVGNGTDDPGFSSYGSIGGYSIAVDMQPGATTTTTTTVPAAQPPTPQAGGDRLRSISPLRVLDTRAESSPTDGRLRGGQNLRLDLEGAPPETTAAVVNVVAVDPSGAGWLSVTPCNDVPLSERTSSINFSPGRNIANSIVAPLTDDGEVCVFASVATHIVVDVTGWIGASGSLTLDDIGSVRVVDSRDGLGVSRRLSAGTTAEVDLSDLLSGDDVGAVALNLTAIRPSTRGFLTIDDCSTAQTTSSLNVEAGDIRGNNGVFALGAGQRLCVSTTTTTHLTIDITGEFGSGSGLRFVAASPARVLDTRQQQPLTAGSSTAFEVPNAAGENGLSASPAAASINLTAARPTTGGFVTAWDCGPRPETSALNPTADASTASGALVPLSQNGRSCLFHSNGGHLIVDLAGWWV